MLPVEYRRAFVSQPEEAFRTLWDELAWQRRGSTPQREYYCNDVGAPYTYGKGAGVRTYEPQAWHPVVRRLQQQLARLCEVRFEVCFLNSYEDSSDHLGWHADDSAEMDPARPIAVVSLGAEREIWFREKGSPAVHKLKLEHGSLCLTAPGMQRTHERRIRHHASGGQLLCASEDQGVRQARLG